MKLFQSTLPRRERPSWEILSVRRRYFNPRSREGSDPREELIASRCIISIHAPAKGPISAGADTAASLFQSTLPRRERQHFPHGWTRHLNFNPRSREGSDPTLFPFFYFCFPYFNPRSREGSDQSCKHITASGIISIHAPAKGATTMLMIVVQVRVISIHAPAKGATLCQP